MGFLQKIQKQPKYIRQIILWSITIVLGLILFTVWAIIAHKNLSSFPREEFIKELNLPPFKEGLENFKDIEIPGNIEQELGDLQESSD